MVVVMTSLLSSWYSALCFWFSKKQNAERASSSTPPWKDVIRSYVCTKAKPYPLLLSTLSVLVNASLTRSHQELTLGECQKAPLLLLNTTLSPCSSFFFLKKRNLRSHALSWNLTCFVISLQYTWHGCTWHGTLKAGFWKSNSDLISRSGSRSRSQEVKIHQEVKIKKSRNQDQGQEIKKSRSRNQRSQDQDVKIKKSRSGSRL